MRILAIVLACGAAATAVPAQLESGPKPGGNLTKVAVYAPLGRHQGKEFDAAKELGQGPGALLFVKALTRETAPILRELDQLGATFGALGFRSFTILLAGDRNEGEATVKRVSRAIQMRNPMTISLDGAEGPGNYALHRDATLTLVTVKGGVVAQSIAFTDTGFKDVPRVRQAIEAVAGKLPRDGAKLAASLPDDPARLKQVIAGLWTELLRTQSQLERLQNNRRGRAMRGTDRMQPARRDRGDGRKREGKAPNDPALQGLIRALIQKDNTDKDLDAVFAKIDAAVGTDSGKQRQMVEGMKLVLSLEYGTAEARKRARAYVEKHGVASQGGKDAKKL
ncbi:MAG: hypothetical protein KDC87_20990 [Planctomycetes bacterium]|nr:hypothetical protein [Planctomycetota bacterium]MCB9870724.1 hypothetical protein [Planctomycetota bacterium]MCB9889059.1 hypothetical protein [Planctomycetota bacterium]